MSCLDVLYQPYATQVYHSKHSSSFRSQKYGFPLGSTSSNLSVASGSLALPRPAPYNLMDSKSKAERDHESQSQIRFSSIDTKHRARSTPNRRQQSDELPTSAFSYSHSSSFQPSCQMLERTLSEKSNSDKASMNSDSVFYENEAKSSNPLCYEPSKAVQDTSCSRSLSERVEERITDPTPSTKPISCRLKKQKSPPAHRVSSRCVMFNYFDGKTCDEVDEHFSRALSQDSKSPPKDLPSPMSKRNFPASFWNSEYQLPSPPPVSGMQVMDGARGMMLSFNRGSALSSFLPSHHHPSTFSRSTNGRFPASSLDLASTFDPYQSSCGFSGFQDHLHQTVSAAAAAAAVASRGVSDPWNPYAGLSSSISGQNLYTHRAMSAAAAAAATGVQDLYGLSAAAVAAAASQSLDHRYNSLLMQPSSSLRSTNSLPGLTGRASDINKDASSLWPVPHYSGFRF